MFWPIRSRFELSFISVVIPFGARIRQPSRWDVLCHQPGNDPVLDNTLMNSEHMIHNKMEQSFS